MVDCRLMCTRRCPVSGCEGLPCARIEDDDESRWAPEDFTLPEIDPEAESFDRLFEQYEELVGRMRMWLLPGTADVPPPVLTWREDGT